ncbi:MAG: hypothetical protein WBB07_17415 [Mycobacterium sp.]
MSSTGHTYSPETQALLAAVMSGDTCPDCGAPNDQQHFDACVRHPENSPKPWVVNGIEVNPLELHRDGDLVSVQMADGRIFTEYVEDLRRRVGPKSPEWLQDLLNKSERFIREAYGIPTVDTEAELRRELATVTDERDALIRERDELADRVHDLEEWAREPKVVER